ncbi:hypothetical protein LTR91_025766 [Friedmanniomyces endolithicus]|uniref:Exonuclease V n=1 Tax=Friedmanniomyces endolithicus TaxID=329885 RepID=A0AAN6GYN8_9PEZI|nr:hypothetical protein LTR91_025766 [Friedmanniomyces endolithicus]
MATPLSPQDNAASITLAEESDYGSDLDEATVDALFSPPEPDVEKTVILDDHGDSRQPVARLARTRGKPSQASTGASEDENGAGEEWDGTEGVETREVHVREEHDDLEILLAHNTLEKLWGFMTQEFARTIPKIPPASASAPPISTSTLTPTSISALLTAEFRSASSGNLIGKRHFPFSAPALDAYVADELSWWRGERATKGVEMEEAFKCGYCEFAEGCGWRAGKVEEGVQKAKLRREEGLTRRKSRV